MPKILFYAGTAFCLFLALSSAAEAVREIQSSGLAFAAINSAGLISARSAGAIVVALLAGLAAAAIFVRMAALLAARNLFGAFMALFSVTGAVVTLSGLLLIQARIVVLSRQPASSPTGHTLSELHFVLFLLLGYFVSLSLLSLRPYFRVQASRMLSLLVFLPMPMFILVLFEVFVSSSSAPLPGSSPASLVFFAIVGVLFFAIAVHCIRHRHLFLEMTNLRELLDGRVDPTARSSRRPIGGVAFDS